MPHINEIDYSVVYALEDTFTYTRTRDLFPVALSGLDINDGLYILNDSDSYNCNLGANDKAYNNLVADGDTINLHFRFPDYVNTDNTNPSIGWRTGVSTWYMDIDMLAPDGSVLVGNLADMIGAHMVGYANGFSFQNLQLDYSWPDCFYFRIAAKNEDGTSFTFYTEPFQKVNCENTILLTGNYSGGYDNFDFYYGVGEDYFGTSNFAHTLQMRLEGELINTGFNHTHTQVAGETISSVQNEVYRLRLAAVPPYQAKRISNLLAAPSFIIDGVTFTRAKAITQNNEEGSMWFIDTELERDNTELNFDCN